jgi:hypothetical protein
MYLTVLIQPIVITTPTIFRRRYADMGEIRSEMKARRPSGGKNDLVNVHVL